MSIADSSNPSPDSRSSASSARADSNPSTPKEVVGTINIPILARVCDDIRATIITYRPPGPWPHLTELSGLMTAFLADEEAPKMHISLDTIRACRLDRLLDDILEPEHHPKNGEGGETFTNLVRMAYRLQRIWVTRFQGAYQELDDVRCKEMLSMGRLHGLRFCTEGHPRWVAKKGAEDIHATSMEPGMWFLNLACVKRHGIEGDRLEDLSINGTRVLPLLWGKEETITSDLVKYTREGNASEMLYSLLTHVGRSSHLLRGYQLRGPYSPTAGIRYDGLYNLRSFAMKRDPVTGVYRLTLTGDRVPDQTPLQTLRAVPRPAELDDWRLCGRVEEREMRKAGRGDEYAEWKRKEKGDSIGL